MRCHRMNEGEALTKTLRAQRKGTYDKPLRDMFLLYSVLQARFPLFEFARSRKSPKKFGCYLSKLGPQKAGCQLNTLGLPKLGCCLSTLGPKRGMLVEHAQFFAHTKTNPRDLSET